MLERLPCEREEDRLFSDSRGRSRAVGEQKLSGGSKGEQLSGATWFQCWKAAQPPAPAPQPSALEACQRADTGVSVL